MWYEVMTLKVVRIDKDWELGGKDYEPSECHLYVCLFQGKRNSRETSAGMEPVSHISLIDSFLFYDLKTKTLKVI